MALNVAQLMDIPGGPGIIGAISAGTGITISGSGVASLSTSGVTPGTYTSTDLTVDAYGRIISASNGSGGGGGTPYFPAQRFLVSGGGSTGGNGNIGSQSVSMGSFTCTYPAGCNRAVRIMKVSTSSAWAGSTGSTQNGYAQGTISATTSGSASDPGGNMSWANSTGASSSGSYIQATPQVRIDVMTGLSTSGGSFTVSFTGSQSTSQNVQTIYNQAQIVIIPFFQ